MSNFNYYDIMPKVVRGTIAKLAEHFGAEAGSTDLTRPFKPFVVEVCNQERLCAHAKHTSI